MTALARPYPVNSTSGEDAKWTAPSSPSPATYSPWLESSWHSDPGRESLCSVGGTGVDEPQMSLLSVSLDARTLGESAQEELLHIP